MTFWFLFLIAVISTALCLCLWFREVRRVMQERKSTVESAGRHLTEYRKRLRTAYNDPDVAAVLARSEDIYRQAVILYNQTLRKPLNYLPARLMGYQCIS